ncbi:hypothetical protein ATCC90586_007041 [Pythium insidiosum]|nr:hypothetical protein ATCC90586_007041 [Pythium insidiosum]
MALPRLLAASMSRIDYVIIELAWLAREAFQVGFQTAQAYNISKTVTSPWLQHAIVLALCANCWSTPVLNALLRRPRYHLPGADPSRNALTSKSYREYMASVLLVDTILEATTFWVIPGVIIAPSVNGVTWMEGTPDATLEWKFLELLLVLPHSYVTLLSSIVFATLMLFAVASLELPHAPSITLEHCHALAMPARLQSLVSLESILLYNCTILSWESDAAISADCHENLSNLAFVRVTFPSEYRGQFPDSPVASLEGPQDKKGGKKGGKK